MLKDIRKILKQNDIFSKLSKEKIFNFLKTKNISEDYFKQIFNYDLQTKILFNSYGKDCLIEFKNYLKSIYYLNLECFNDFDDDHGIFISLGYIFNKDNENNKSKFGVLFLFNDNDLNKLDKNSKCSYIFIEFNDKFKNNSKRINK